MIGHSSNAQTQPDPAASWPLPRGEAISRSLMFTIVQIALTVGETSFARKAVLSWLTAFPGDLPMGLLHAQALIREEKGRRASNIHQAIAILESICQTDPEYLEAYELLARARRYANRADWSALEANLVALGGLMQAKTTVPNWANLLRQARKALTSQEQNALTRPVAHTGPQPDGVSGEQIETGSSLSSHQVLAVAEQLVHQSLTAEPAPPLAGITHLEITGRRNLPAAGMRSLAEMYHARWPSCLQFTLFLADALMDGGEADQAVILLHEAAARDVTGQVPARLWGQDHPYRNLWPEKLELRLDLAVPASVAAVLGWNRLPAGSSGENPAAGEPADVQLPSAPEILESVLTDTRQDPAAQADAPETAKTASPSEDRPSRRRGFGRGRRSEQPAPAVELDQPAFSLPEEDPTEELRDIQLELSKVAGSIKKGQLVRSDGRFPVYVLFTTRAGLEKTYGQQKAAVVESAMNRLAEAVRSRRNWGAITYFADEGLTLPSKRGDGSLSLPAAKPDDAWRLKLALTDLDGLLAKHGEMIGCLVIVGGPEVVPFHHLPNPVDDSDLDIPSDNPYATRDENYFIPEWPMGRIPGGSGSDPQLLLNILQNMAAAHQEAARRREWYSRLWSRIMNWFWKARNRPSLGYTAAIWKRASTSVFRPIGDGQAMLVSPPIQASQNGHGLANGNSAASELLSPARLGYFNLHGLPDSAEWYGQCDPSEPSDGPDYPVALRPQDFGNGNGNHPPQVVFSEACYGAHIIGKSPTEALSFKFLSSGSQAVVGSTCTAYGSVTEPLTAADLLGFAFWNYIRDGIPAGEALRRAKLYLARVMHRRQGYLDGEDQKTLISFILYGDPLVYVNGFGRRAKGILRPLKSPGPIKAVCDRTGDPLTPEPVPPQVMTYVKHVVAQYLPGMADADISLTQEHADCTGDGHTCPTSQMGAKARPTQLPARKVVTLSKQVRQATFIHRHYARLTLDADGKLVKLVVSR